MSHVAAHETIVYLVSEAEARVKLRDLWLRELECWCVDGNGRRRLDADYQP